MSVKKEIGRVGRFLAAAVVIVIALGILITQLPRIPEIMMGGIIVLAVSVLMVLLFAMAAGFAGLKLSDSRQALGLPEGSVRALIALFLIMVFVVFGLFMFREVAHPDTTTLPGLTAAQVAELAEENVVAVRKGESVIETFDVEIRAGDSITTTTTLPGLTAAQVAELAEENEVTVNEGEPVETFDVEIRVDVTEEGARLAQQLLTTVGTLVVAVAGFYFGSRAVAAARGVAVSPEPSIKSIEPNVGEAGKEIPVKISGKDFDGPVVVKLVKGSKTILEIKDPPCSSKEIACTFNLKGIDHGVYDLVVVNQDGGKDQEDGAFTVTAVPTVTSISPAKGKDKVPVTIKGKDFVKGAQVKLKQAGQADIPVAVEDKNITPTEITCTLDLTDKTGTWDVVVINPGEKESKLPKAFTVEAAPPAPTVEKIDPPGGKASEGEVTVTITGTGLTKEAKVELRKEGQDPIKAKGEVEVVEAGKKIKCTFDLKDKTPGDWDVFVKVGKKEVTKKGVFKVE